MRFGIVLMVTDQTIGPVELGRAVEERGFSSLFVPEHTHIPASRRTPAPMGEPLPEPYRRTYDPFVALAAAAAVTETLELGTGVCLVAQHDPIILAKTIASLDLLSGGRFTLGVGYGWNVEEMQHHGVDPRTRRALTREKMLAMARLWEDEAAEFRGRYVEFEPSWSWPKPSQHPRPRVLLGGLAGETLFRHIAEYGDGWMPIGASGLGRSLPDLRQAFEDAGRDPAEIDLRVFGGRADPSTLDYYESLGVREVLFMLEPGPAEVVLPALDAAAKAVTGR